MHPLKAIAAMATNRVIGSGGRIPWHLPADFRWFKQCTMGQVLIMGRKTFESIGRPLPGRQTMVFTRSGFTHPGVTVVHSIEELSERVEGDPREVWVVGGAEIYSQLLPYCTDIFLTVVKHDVVGDCLFPRFEDRFVLVAAMEENADFRIEHHTNRDRLLA